MPKKVLSTVQRIIKQRLGVEEKRQLVEGQLEISFTFAGQLYVQKHLFNSTELRVMKKMIEDHGEASAQQILWRAAIVNSGILAENVLAHAARDYCKKHFKGEEEPEDRLPVIDPTLIPPSTATVEEHIFGSVPLIKNSDVIEKLVPDAEGRN